MGQAKYGSIDQIGLVVADLDASIQRWIARLGVGPWTVMRNVELNGNYCGQDTQVRMDVGFGYQGDVQIELIQVTNSAPSPYRSPSGAILEGLHHIAWIIDDLDATSLRASEDGLELVFRADSPGTRVAYFRSTDDPGVLLEFIESADTRQLVTDGLVATKEWDGTEPAIHIVDLAAIQTATDKRSAS